MKLENLRGLKFRGGVDGKGMLSERDLSKMVQEKRKDVVVETPNSATNEPQPKPKPKWIVPVVIGVGAILLGVVIYFVTKKKK
jgi:hypothetical protein